MSDTKTCYRNEEFSVFFLVIVIICIDNKDLQIQKSIVEAFVRCSIQNPHSNLFRYSMQYNQFLPNSSSIMLQGEGRVAQV